MKARCRLFNASAHGIVYERLMTVGKTCTVKYLYLYLLAVRGLTGHKTDWRRRNRLRRRRIYASQISARNTAKSYNNLRMTALGKATIDPNQKYGMFSGEMHRRNWLAVIAA